MNNQELITLALNSLKANKLRSGLTTLGIIIGVFAVILLVSIGAGLQKYISDQITSLGSNLIFVVPGRIGGARTPGGQQTNKLTLTDAKDLELKLRDVAEVGPIIQKTTLVKYENKSDKGVAVFGTTATYPDIIKTAVEQGRFFSTGQERAGNKVVLIGQTVWKNLFFNGQAIGKRISISGNKYTVIGILAKRGSVFGLDQDNTVVIPITAAQHQFGLNNVNTIYISAKDSKMVTLVQARATDILLHRLTEDDFTVQNQEQTLSTINNITNILTIALGGIAAISLIVGGIGVMNIMLVSVTERTKEIGLRKALGARKNDILKQFLLEAVFLSLVGGIIGIIFGMGASFIVSKIFVSEVPLWSVLLAFGFSVAVGIIFGMAPAIRASQLSPIEALRHE